MVDENVSGVEFTAGVGWDELATRVCGVDGPRVHLSSEMQYRCGGSWQQHLDVAPYVLPFTSDPLVRSTNYARRITDLLSNRARRDEDRTSG